MSCYAFFKRWLLPSLRYDCLNFLNSFHLNYNLSPYRLIWAVSLLTINLSIYSLTPQINFNIFEVFKNLVKLYTPLAFKELYPIKIIAGYTKIYFAENQLSLSLISLSLLITSHLNLFQQKRVRSFKIYFYNFFNLLMIRSLSFGFYKKNFKYFFKFDLT